MIQKIKTVRWLSIVYTTKTVYKYSKSTSAKKLSEVVMCRDSPLS